jgi:hypothetical protein
MKRSLLFLMLVLAAVSILESTGCSSITGANNSINPIVGAWLVKDLGAPFPYHMYVFNADGTMQQANPDAGDPHTSDSDGKGVWVADGTKIKGKWMEVTADRATHKYSGRTEITYDIKVNGDNFIGTLSARAYDINDTLSEGPTRPTTLEGKRVTLP